MPTIYKFLCFCLLTVCSSAQAQLWSPASANWIRYGDNSYGSAWHYDANYVSVQGRFRSAWHVINYSQNISQLGYSPAYSITGNYTINCSAMTYMVMVVKHYSSHFGRGQITRVVKDSEPGADNWKSVGTAQLRTFAEMICAR